MLNVRPDIVIPLLSVISMVPEISTTARIAVSALGKDLRRLLLADDFSASLMEIKLHHGELPRQAHSLPREIDILNLTRNKKRKS